MPAPIAAGEPVATLVIRAGEQPEREVPGCWPASTWSARASSGRGYVRRRAHGWAAWSGEPTRPLRRAAASRHAGRAERGRASRPRSGGWREGRCAPRNPGAGGDPRAGRARPVPRRIRHLLVEGDHNHKTYRPVGCHDRGAAATSPPAAINLRATVWPALRPRRPGSSATVSRTAPWPTRAYGHGLGREVVEPAGGADLRRLPARLDPRSLDLPTEAGLARGRWPRRAPASRRRIGYERMDVGFHPAAARRLSRHRPAGAGALRRDRCLPTGRCGRRGGSLRRCDLVCSIAPRPEGRA